MFPVKLTGSQTETHPEKSAGETLLAPVLFLESDFYFALFSKSDIKSPSLLDESIFSHTANFRKEKKNKRIGLSVQGFSV